MRDESVPKPIMVYMPQDVYKNYSYTAWKFLTQAGITGYRIPANVFKEVTDKNQVHSW